MCVYRYTISRFWCFILENFASFHKTITKDLKFPWNRCQHQVFSFLLLLLFRDGITLHLELTATPWVSARKLINILIIFLEIITTCTGGSIGSYPRKKERFSIFTYVLYVCLSVCREWVYNNTLSSRFVLMKKYRFSKTEFIVHKTILKRLRQIKFYVFCCCSSISEEYYTHPSQHTRSLSHVRITYGI